MSEFENNGPSHIMMDESTINNAKVKVFGVGGAGGNTVNRMVGMNIEGVEYYAVNTDAKALELSKADHKIAIGQKTTKSLGAGMRPDVGKKAAEENKGKAKRGRGRPKGGSVEKTAAQKEAEIMKNSKYPLLMNPDHLSESYQAKLREILLYDRRLATAYRLKEGLRAIFHLPAEEVRPALQKWRRRAWSCRDKVQ